MENHDMESRLQLGEFCCALRFKDVGPEFDSSVKDYFKHFIVDKEPDIRIDIEIIFHKENISLPQSLCISKTVDGNSFNYHTGLIKGNIDLDKQKCYLQVKKGLFNGTAVRIFEQFFHQMYFTLLENKYGANRYDRIMVHSCGVLKNGRGYIFTGPSGIGKSTIAEMSTDYAVLNDEMCFINDTDSRYVVRSTPFNGFFNKKVNMSGLLNTIFLLKQDTKNFIKKIKFADAVVALAKEIVPPIGVLTTVKSKYSVTAMFDMAVKVLSKVPFYELHFALEKNPWDCIGELEQNNNE
jgi:hypothetical protein